MMDFKRLSARYFAGAPGERALAVIEYRSQNGLTIAAGATSQETAFIAKGDGSLEYRRRGDFMERGDVFPGVWRAKCDPADLEKAWQMLGDLGPHSFPARVTDPGDTITRLAAFFPDTVETLVWGPPDHSVPMPGSQFIAALAPLMIKADEGDALWSVEMTQSSIRQTAETLEVVIELKNEGTAPIGFVLPFPAGRSGFKLRYASRREVPEGVTPLPMEWTWTPLELPGQTANTLWRLLPEEPLQLILRANLNLDGGRVYLGKIQYEQIDFLDELAGLPIFSGACFTSAFKFST